MNEKKDQRFWALAFTMGTPECAVFSAVLAMIAALLFLWLGFWKTVFIALLTALGAFIGGVKNKLDWLRDCINRLFPARSSVPYKHQRRETARSAGRRASQEAGEDFQQPPYQL